MISVWLLIIWLPAEPPVLKEPAQEFGTQQLCLDTGRRLAIQNGPKYLWFCIERRSAKKSGKEA
jgi:hypothetical protein